MTTKKVGPGPSVEKKLLEGNSSVGSQARDLYCEVCQKPFTGEQSKLEHMRSEKHKRKAERSAAAPPNTNTLGQFKQVSRELHCEFCQKWFTGAESKREHEQSQKHRRKVETFNTEQLLKVSTPSKAVAEKERSHAKECQGLVPALKCSPCRKVFSGQESLEEHLKSRKHLNIVK